MEIIDTFVSNVKTKKKDKYKYYKYKKNKSTISSKITRKGMDFSGLLRDSASVFPFKPVLSSDP